jgi:hypothetical protein
VSARALTAVLLACWLGVGGCGSKAAPAPTQPAATSAATPPEPAAAAFSEASIPTEPLSFDVTFDRGTLHIVGLLPAGAHVTTDDDTNAWVQDTEVRVGGAFRTIAPTGDAAERVIPACGAAECVVRYDFALRDCARKLNDPETAAERRGTLAAPSSTFLLLPRGDGYPAHRFRVHAPRFASGAPLVDGFYRQGAAEYTLPISVFNADDLRSFTVGNASFELAFVAGPMTVGHDAFLARLRRTVERIADYDGRFPAPHTLVVVQPTDARHDGTPMGVTLAGGGGASVLLGLPGEATAADLDGDWVLTHELLHVAFPSVGRPHRWMEEGLSTYLEPIIRVRDGTVGADKFWGDLVAGLPQGLPEAGSHGLEHTETWGSTYWGGALYWFEVDLAIRRSSHGQRSLRDALRAIADAGGFAGQHWPIERVVEIGDRGAGSPVLKNVLAELGETGERVDLAAVWAQLGIHVHALGRTPLQLDDRAPEAALRPRIASGT